MRSRKAAVSSWSPPDSPPWSLSQSCSGADANILHSYSLPSQRSFLWPTSAGTSCFKFTLGEPRGLMASFSKMTSKSRGRFPLADGLGGSVSICLASVVLMLAQDGGPPWEASFLFIQGEQLTNPRFWYSRLVWAPLEATWRSESWLGQGGADVSSLLFLRMPLEESNLGERRLGVTPSLLSCDFFGSIS